MFVDYKVLTGGNVKWESDPHSNTHDYPPVNNLLPTSKVFIPRNHLSDKSFFITSNNQNNTEEN